MRFVFKRDEEGIETIHAEASVVAVVKRLDAESASATHFRQLDDVGGRVEGVHISMAIGLADEAGFWTKHLHETGPCESQWLTLCPHEVFVEVPSC